METPKNKSWNFCETPEEKCTMNYCNENGCQNRKRNLVEPKKSKAATFILGQIDKAIEKSTLEQQIEKLEADKVLYRKVAIIEEPKHNGNYHCIFPEGHIFTIPFLKEYGFHDEFTDCSGITHYLEEIPDPTIQLQADKAELLEALENLMEYGSTGEDAVEMKREIESLIQKHKQ